MAGKARLLENVIQNAIESDVKSDANNSLRNEMEIFKANLIHDITPESFADIYAQTIAYGMFAARLHDLAFQKPFPDRKHSILFLNQTLFLEGFLTTSVVLIVMKD